MNTVKIHNADLREFILDLKRWQIRHYPFCKTKDGLIVTMFPSPKVNWILLKYPNMLDTPA